MGDIDIEAVLRELKRNTGIDILIKKRKLEIIFPNKKYEKSDIKTGGFIFTGLAAALSAVLPYLLTGAATGAASYATQKVLKKIAGEGVKKNNKTGNKL